MLKRLLAMSLLLGLSILAPAQEPREISARYLLMDARGRAVTQEDFRGRWQLITFGFTSCPDVCPTTLLEFKQILDALGTNADRLQPIFISVDPERDSAGVLHDYTQAFDKRILGLSGSSELTRSAANNFKVRYSRVVEPGAASGIYTMEHSVGMFLLGTDGQFLMKFSYATPVRDITQRIRDVIAPRRSR